MQWHLNIFNLFGPCQHNYSVENLWKIILSFKVVIFLKTIVQGQRTDVNIELVAMDMHTLLCPSLLLADCL